MITSVVFSKDRPLQLDLTLKSIKKNFGLSKNIKVIYKTEYENSYEVLKVEHPDVIFIKQGAYLVDSLLLASQGEYICYFTDDNIFFQKSELTELDLKEMKASASCISLRLGININRRDYGTGILELDNIPLHIGTNSTKNMLVWNRLSVCPGGYWSYALSVDGHIFPQESISFILNTMKHWPETYSSLQTPNKFEAMLQRFFFEVSPYMMSEKHSRVVNSPNNRVQDEYENLNGTKFSYTPKLLNDLFLSGERICLEKLDFKGICCPHYEINLLEGLV